MADIGKMFTELMKSSAAKGFAGGMAGGLATNMLSKKSARKLGKNALKLGGAAAVGALAFSAYKRYQAGQQPGSLSMNDGQPADVKNVFHASIDDTAFLPSPDDKPANDDLALTLTRAMIAASRADGSMDSEESQLIFERIQTLDLDAESKNLLIQEMNHPVDMDSIVSRATTEEIAAEIYTASLLAIKLDNQAEEAYLAMLAARMNLPQPLASAIREQVISQQQALPD